MAEETMSFLSDDDHAGGLIGVLLGIVFLTIGLCIAFIRDRPGLPIPTWRRLTGILITALGVFATLTGMVFLIQDD
jgi:hypothetical protein